MAREIIIIIVWWHGLALPTAAVLTAYYVATKYLCGVALWPQNLYISLLLIGLKNRHGHCLCWMSTGRKNGLNPTEPQSRFGDKLLQVWVVCPQTGTAVLKGLMWRTYTHLISYLDTTGTTYTFYRTRGLDPLFSNIRGSQQPRAATVTTELVSLLRFKNRHGHRLYWMSTGRKNGLM